MVPTVRGCAQAKTGESGHRAKLVQDIPGMPMERMAVDLMGPLPKTENGNLYIAVVVDYFTKWAEAHRRRYRRQPVDQGRDHRSFGRRLTHRPRRSRAEDWYAEARAERPKYTLQGRLLRKPELQELGMRTLLVPQVSQPAKMDTGQR